MAQVREFDRRQQQVIDLYWNCRDDLATDHGLVYRGYRLVIPAKERSNIFKSLHESDDGIEGTLRRARDIVYLAWNLSPAKRLLIKVRNLQQLPARTM